MRLRLRDARFPEVKTLDAFDFAAADGVNATQIHTLARGEWVTTPENLILAGPIGTGKTHLTTALGVELLFNLLTDRDERRATVVTTNLAFAEWVTVFAGDEKLTTASPQTSSQNAGGARRSKPAHAGVDGPEGGTVTVVRSELVE